MTASRLPGFYKLTLAERRRSAARALGVSEEALAEALRDGGLEVELADKTVENVVGTYALPFSLALNVRMNGRDHLAPMVVEEPSVVAAASSAAKLVREGHGFDADSDPPLMIAQIQLSGVEDPTRASEALWRESADLLRRVDALVPSLVARGGGARGVEVRDLGDGFLVVHLLIDCRNAMGANLLNTVAEALADRVAEVSGGGVGLKILSNLSDRRMVRVRCAVPAAALALDGYPGEEVRDRIVQASEFAERDPYRAATHNKGIMNGIDPVALATGNDWRAVEAGAHAYAARGGSYAPLSTWRCGDGGALVGAMELPLALGTVGGLLRVHRGARFALDVTGVESARKLSMLAGCVGLASNLAALRSLATHGIQRGHMALHARSVAIAAGARGDLVEQVATRIHAEGRVSLDAAREVVRSMGAPSGG